MVGGGSVVVPTLVVGAACDAGTSAVVVGLVGPGSLVASDPQAVTSKAPPIMIDKGAHLFMASSFTGCVVR